MVVQRRWGQGSALLRSVRCLRHVGNCDYRVRRFRRNLRAVILYGTASALSDDIEDWYRSRDQAEATLAGILRDEAVSRRELRVEEIEFEQSVN